GQAEARDLLDPDARRDGLDDDERQHPREEGPPPVAVADTGEPDETRGLTRGGGHSRMLARRAPLALLQNCSARRGEGHAMRIRGVRASPRLRAGRAVVVD